MGVWNDILNNNQGTKFNYAKFDRIVDSSFVKKLRKKLDLSQRAFSTVLGISPKTVEKWEQGANPCKGTASRLLFLLDEHPDLAEELLAYEDVQTGKPVKEAVFKPIYYCDYDWKEIISNSKSSETQSPATFAHEVYAHEVYTAVPQESLANNIVFKKADKGALKFRA